MGKGQSAKEVVEADFLGVDGFDYFRLDFFEVPKRQIDDGRDSRNRLGYQHHRDQGPRTEDAPTGIN